MCVPGEKEASFARPAWCTRPVAGGCSSGLGDGAGALDLGCLPWEPRGSTSSQCVWTPVRSAAPGGLRQGRFSGQSAVSPQDPEFQASPRASAELGPASLADQPILRALPLGEAGRAHAWAAAEVPIRLHQGAASHLPSFFILENFKHKYKWGGGEKFTTPHLFPARGSSCFSRYLPTLGVAELNPEIVPLYL